MLRTVLITALTTAALAGTADAAVVGIATAPASAGYWLAADDGTVTPYNGAPNVNGQALATLQQPIRGFAPTHGAGVWRVGGDGGVFAAGDAQFYGSAAGRTSAPVIGIAGTPSSQGYWLVQSNGTVIQFGDAKLFSGDTIPLNKPISGIAGTPTGNGYWLVGEDGGVFAYGDAGFYGSEANVNLQAKVVGIAPTPTGKGYWLVAEDGGVFAHGDAAFHGSPAGAASKVVGLAAALSGKGYRVAQANGRVVEFGDNTYEPPPKQPPITGEPLPSVPTDADADGVADSSDQCTGLAGPLSRNGCPSGLVNDPSIRYKIGRRGIRVLAYYVKATTGARVVVTCSRGCKRTVTKGRGAHRVRIRALNGRRLTNGTGITVTVTRPGRLTTVVKDRVSHGRRIEGRARCTRPGTTTPQVGC